MWLRKKKKKMLKSLIGFLSANKIDNYNRQQGRKTEKRKKSERIYAAKSLQLCPSLCDPIDGSPPGSHVPGILQARTLEWVAISLRSSNWVRWYLPKWVKSLHLHINLHMDIYNSFIYNCQNLEITKMPFSRLVNKLCYILTMEYYSTVRRNELSSHENTGRKLKCILLSERSQSKKAACCVTLIIQYSGKSKTIENGRFSDC